MGNDFKKLKFESWIYYKQWMNERTYSPALKKEIRVTRKGCDHLFGGKRSKSRNIKDKINSLIYLELQS